MKKLFSILAFALCLTSAASAQTAGPRYDTTHSGDNTGRVLTYRYFSLQDNTGADSVALSPRAWFTIIPIAMTDSFCLKQPIITQCYAGDNLEIIASGQSGTKVKFYGSYWITTGTATLSTKGRAVIKFVFDGAYWVEANRTVQ